MRGSILPHGVRPVSLHASCPACGACLCTTSGLHQLLACSVYGSSHCWADPHLMAHPLVTCRMLEVTTPGQEDRLQVDFAEIYRNSQLAK